MFATIRRHQKWLWAIIIAVIIVSFVIFFSPNVSLDRGRSGDFGTINGRAIGQTQFYDAYREAILGYFFRYGTWPSQDEASRTGFDPDRETRNRLLLIDVMNDNKIQVGTDATAKWIANLPFLQDRRTKAFREEIYGQFVKTVLREKGLGEADFERFARHEVGIQQLIAVFGLTGKLVTPREAEANYRWENSPLLTDLALFSASNYLASVKVAPDELAQFYTNQLSAYRTPERVQVSYVKFDRTNYFGEADLIMTKDTNWVQRINEAYLDRGTNLFLDDLGKPMSEAVAKDKMRQEIRNNYAMQYARRRAGEFDNELFEKEPRKAENLAAMAAAKMLVVKETEPFSLEEEPKGLKVTESFNTAAFKLTADEPLSLPIVGEDGVYVLALVKKVPSATPPFDSVRARVVEDFRQYRARELARQAGASFNQALTNGLAQGKSFPDICAAAKVQPIAVPEFSLSTRTLKDWDERVELGTLKEMASTMAAGTASGFEPSRDGGFVLYVRARPSVNETTLKQDLPQYLAGMRLSRQYQAFAEWMTHAINAARMTSPSRGATAQ